MKKILSLLLAIIMVIGLCPLTVFAGQSAPLALESGKGTKDEPYLIYTAEDLAAFSASCHLSFVQRLWRTLTFLPLREAGSR